MCLSLLHGTVTLWVLNEYNGAGSSSAYAHAGNDFSRGQISMGLNGASVGEVIKALQKRDPNLKIEYTPQPMIES